MSATQVIVLVPVSGKARAEVTAAVHTHLQTSKDSIPRLDKILKAGKR